MKLATVRSADGSTQAVRVEGADAVPLGFADVGTLLAQPNWREIAADARRELQSASERALLPTPIPDKGRILTAMTVWWFGQLDGLGRNHLQSVDDPAIPRQWRGRAMLCTPLAMVPVPSAKGDLPFAFDISMGVRMTYQRMPSVHGGVVSEPAIAPVTMRISASSLRRCASPSPSTS